MGEGEIAHRSQVTGKKNRETPHLPATNRGEMVMDLPKLILLLDSFHASLF